MSAAQASISAQITCAFAGDGASRYKHSKSVLVSQLISLDSIRCTTNLHILFQVNTFAADFLDPLHHEVATGRPSVNLDGWMLNKQQNLESFHRHAADADICIVEGVMGLFDGRDGMTEAGSTAELAKWLGAPVLLVMDCWSVARSAAAMVKGYQEFDPDLNLAGVIFNKIGSKAHTQWLTEAVQATGVQTKVFGGIPKVCQAPYGCNLADLQANSSNRASAHSH